jgi:GNAT superfamily N-acetyltransferase
VNVKLSKATSRDAVAIAKLRNAAAAHLTEVHGKGHWSGCVTERGVLFHLSFCRVLLARIDRKLAGTVSLQARKPWAIDTSYFTAVRRPLYLTSMAVAPKAQGKGVGRLLMEAAEAAARAWPAEAIRLDAYDHAAGASAFYAACGFREVGRTGYRGVPLVYFERLL